LRIAGMTDTEGSQALATEPVTTERAATAQLINAMRFLWIGQGLDCLTFLLVALPFGVSGESNPLIQALAGIVGGGQGLVLGVIVLKLLIIGLVVASMKLALLGGASRLALILMIVGANLGLFGALTNTYSLWILTR
jgi:hypothetical protein